MDSTIINIRILDWHFKIERETWKPRISRNRYHSNNGYPDGYAKIYRLFGYAA
jgi:hypothetical protein